jgi:hypothetical protein
LNDAHVGRELVASFDPDNIARNDISRAQVDQLTVADYVTLFGQHLLD